ncbi:uncharacterized protein MYCFIDRAFT_210020 [Pseudocercospora fijiensis CIRAD86]|uniref:Uncharacterized protein n=1 Tax=Pseudocercospora fijiensis (strain CIRAD86) TaxID=383855 RepID=N1QCE4_PSEFD|nr:uncharacterized protein MYCFIDRAFT_210020 [Pseudocercospora fijiensis CIRAD86]EME89202.1 hypothetical protein MYCFIDRAFT_210020 [Pseudocercospora fijiensis CIRAD86]
MGYLREHTSGRPGIVVLTVRVVNLLRRMGKAVFRKQACRLDYRRTNLAVPMVATHAWSWGWEGEGVIPDGAQICIIIIGHW